MQFYSERPISWDRFVRKKNESFFKNILIILDHFDQLCVFRNFKHHRRRYQALSNNGTAKQRWHQLASCCVW